MKKLFISFFILTLMSFGTSKVQALSYDDAIGQKQPCAILVYANWADNVSDALSKFSSLEKQYANKYNFVKINIANQEAKSFNKTNYIYPNLPYILLFKDRGRMSRCITQDCLSSNSCIKEKMDLFAN